MIKIFLSDPQYGIYSRVYIQAIIRSAPFGTQLKTAEEEKPLGIASAAELHCEYNNAYIDYIVHY